MCLVPLVTHAEETTAEEGATEEQEIPTKNYVYNVTVEFGYFSFYYDWGVWDTQNFVYKASDSSNNPAAATTLGEPGWYGFDGVNNRIFLKNDSYGGEKEKLFITISFDATKDVDDVKFPVSGVEMACYNTVADEDVHDWSVPNSVEKDGDGKVSVVQTLVYLKEMDAEENGTYQVPLGKTEEETVYISFAGEPYEKDTNNPFIGTTMTKIGFLTVSLSLEDS